MWGIYNKNAGKFCRYYNVCYDENAVAALNALIEKEWIDNNYEINEDIIAKEGVEGFQLYAFETELEAIAELDFWIDTYSWVETSCEVMEIPADEPKWLIL